MRYRYKTGDIIKIADSLWLVTRDLDCVIDNILPDIEVYPLNMRANKLGYHNICGCDDCRSGYIIVK